MPGTASGDNSCTTYPAGRFKADTSSSRHCTPFTITSCAAGQVLTAGTAVTDGSCTNVCPAGWDYLDETTLTPSSGQQTAAGGSSIHVPAGCYQAHPGGDAGNDSCGPDFQPKDSAGNTCNLADTAEIMAWSKLFAGRKFCFGNNGDCMWPQTQFKFWQPGWDKPAGGWYPVAKLVSGESYSRVRQSYFKR